MATDIEQIVKLGLEATGLGAGQSFGQTVEKMRSVLESAGLVVELFNKKTGQLKQTFVAVTPEGERVTLTLQKVGDKFTLITDKIEANINAIQRSKKEYASHSDTVKEKIAQLAAKEAEAAQKRQERNEDYVARLENRDSRTIARAQETARKQQEIDENYVARRENRDTRIAARVQEAARKRQEIDENFVSKQTNRDAQDLQRKLDTINKTSKADFLRTEGVGASDSVRRLFPAPSGATVAQLSSYESKLRTIQSLVSRGAVSMLDVSRFSESVALGKRIDLTGATPGQTQLAGTLTGIKDVTKETNNASEAWNRFTAIITRLVIRQAVFALVGSIRQGVAEFIALESKINQLQVSADGAGVHLSNLSGRILELSNSTGFKQVDLVNAQIEILKQRSVDASSAQELLSVSTKLATASFTTADKAAKSLVEVLNAYGLSNSKAATTSALLFKTSELGKSSIEEVSSTLARLAPDAQVAGLSLNQTAGFLAAMADKGQNASSAANTLTSVVNALTKPSNELKDVYKQLGVFTGEQLVSTFGFIGALEQLNAAVNGDTTKLAELLGGVKGVQAIIGPTGIGFKNLQDRINDVTNSTGRLNQAFDRANSGPGKKLQDEVNNLRNYFLSLGGDIVTTTDRVGAVFGGFSGTVKGVTTAFIALTGAYVGFKAIQLTTAASSQIFASVLESLTEKTIRSRAAIKGLQGGFADLSKTVAFAGLGALAGFELGNLIFKTPNLDKYNKSREDTIELIKSQANQVTEGERAEADKRLQISLDEFDSRIRTVQRFTSEATKEINKITEAQKQNSRDIAETLKLSIEGVVGAEQQKLADIKKLASEARDQIRQSEEFITKGGQKVKEGGFNRELGVLSDPTERINREDEQLKRLDALRQAHIKKGTIDDIKAARDVGDEIARLLDRREQDDITRQKNRVAAGLDQDKVQTRLNPTTNKEEQVIRISLFESERLRNEEIKKRIALEQQSIVLAKAQKETADREAIVQKVRLTSIEDSQRALTGFKLTTDTGELRKDITGFTAKEKVTSALAVFDKQVEAFKTKIGGVLPDELVKDIANRRTDLEREGNRLILLEEDRLGKERLALIQKGNLEQIKAAEGAVEKNRAKLRGDLETASAAAQTVIQTFGKVTKKDIIEDTVAQGIQPGNENVKNFQEARDAVLETAAKIVELNRRTAEGSAGPDVQERVLALAQKLFTETNTAGEAAQTAFPGRKLLGGTVVGQNVLGRLNGQTEGGPLQQPRGILEGAIQTILDSTSQAIKTQKELLESKQNLSQLKEDVPVAAKGFKDLSEIISQLPNNAEGAANKIRLLNQYLRETSTGPKNTDLSGQGGPVQGHARGGLVRAFAEGGFVPRGTDTIPAMLTPGEFVLNAGTTRRFFPLIRAMHEGSLSPTQHLSSGGPVVNVGDINVTVTGGPSKQTARDIAIELRREIRRGVLSLD